MSILINANGIGHSFGARDLFTNLQFTIESGEKVGLIGPNGAGKSTLLKILSGKIIADRGSLSPQKGLRFGVLEQLPTFSPGETIEAAVLSGIEDPYDWEGVTRGHEIMSKLELDKILPNGIETKVDDLSGGWKKRVALGRELAKAPDILLLDEPTNHLDVSGIMWLEDFLQQARFATITITHDRVFLQKVSNRIIEINRRFAGGLLSVKGDYATFLEAKDTLLLGQESREIKLQNTLRRETEWLRQGVRARGTKQQARIKNAGELKNQVQDLGARNQKDKVRLDFQQNEKNPKKLIEAKNISKAYDGQQILPQIDLLISPKTRLGLLGPNGCGKSTLIKILLGKEVSDTGNLFISEQLKIAYFEQNRDQLDQTTTVGQAVAHHGDQVIFRGQSVHIKSYLDRFLFRSEQIDMPVHKLSGGEQARLLIAKLMLIEANILILDEPTNDLDMATLDVLQDVLQDFNGAVILVTHDRYFLDHVTNQILSFETDELNKKHMNFFSNLAQWEDWYEEFLKSTKAKQQVKKAPKNTVLESNTSPEKKRKLTFKEQKELDGMEAEIHSLEKKLKQFASESSDPKVAADSQKLLSITQQMADLQSKIDSLYSRWAELEELI